MFCKSINTSLRVAIDQSLAAVDSPCTKRRTKIPVTASDIFASIGKLPIHVNGTRWDGFRISYRSLASSVDAEAAR